MIKIMGWRELVECDECEIYNEREGLCHTTIPNKYFNTDKQGMTKSEATAKARLRDW